VRSPSERDWERSALLQARPAPRHPQLVGDGAGPPFPPTALDGPGEPLDPADPAVAALLAYLTSHAKPKRSGSPWKRGDTAAPDEPPSLAGWRLLARDRDEALFAFVRAPHLHTAVFRLGRRGDWSCIAASTEPPLRAVRDGIRASSWRLEPSHDSSTQDATLRVLVTEQTFANGKRAYGRVLAPDIYVDDRELVLTVFVTPRPGFQAGSRNPETPVRIALPHPVGERELLDGALAPLPWASSLRAT
jgi:hypothetical protein